MKYFIKLYMISLIMLLKVKQQKSTTLLFLHFSYCTPTWTHVTLRTLAPSWLWRLPSRTSPAVAPRSLCWPLPYAWELLQESGYAPQTSSHTYTDSREQTVIMMMNSMKMNNTRKKHHCRMQLACDVSSSFTSLLEWPLVRHFPFSLSSFHSSMCVILQLFII